MLDEKIIELYLGYPVFLWEGLINFSSVIVAGLIIAFITTFYLKKKDESTRVAGVILEKRVNSLSQLNAISQTVLSELDLDKIIGIIMDAYFVLADVKKNKNKESEEE